jgi:hypothetical protein
MLGAQYFLGSNKGMSIIARLATDQGDIFTKRTGGYLGVRAEW